MSSSHVQRAPKHRHTHTHNKRKTDMHHTGNNPSQVISTNALTITSVNLWMSVYSADAYALFGSPTPTEYLQAAPHTRAKTLGTAHPGLRQ